MELLIRVNINELEKKNNKSRIKINWAKVKNRSSKKEAGESITVNKTRKKGLRDRERLKCKTKKS